MQQNIMHHTHANEFSDGLITINTTYSYKIQLELYNSIKTELSKELKVPF